MSREELQERDGEEGAKIETDGLCEFFIECAPVPVCQANTRSEMEMIHRGEQCEVSGNFTALQGR